jgi:hypothetical protein
MNALTRLPVRAYVMPPAGQPVRDLPADVLSILHETHNWQARLARESRAAAAQNSAVASAYLNVARAYERESGRIRLALRANGCGELAETLARTAWGIVAKPEGRT